MYNIFYFVLKFLKKIEQNFLLVRFSDRITVRVSVTKTLRVRITVRFRLESQLG